MGGVERGSLPFEQQRVVDLYSQGLRGERLAEATGYSYPGGIHHVLNRAGVEKAPSGRPPVDRGEIKERLQQAEFNGLEGEVRLSWVANLVGCSPRTVRRVLKEN